MRILQSWLKDYISFTLPPEVLTEKLIMLGLEFESVEHLGRQFDGFVVGHVLEVARHPNADKLTVCKVNVGREVLQIVCGAPNVAAGQKVPVGLAGATVPHNQHDPSGKPFVLANVKIRGVESFGMICSGRELGLSDDGDGIMILDAKARVGQPLAAHLGMDDVAYDVEITPNRPDWLSHIGVAREVGVLTGKLPHLPKVKVKESSTPIARFLRVKVDVPAECPRFAARMIRGVKVGPSPEWMQQRLRNAGLRPRNNVVDITNYVMLECGQPMHAFDYNFLHGGMIVVRKAVEGTPFRTLDGKDHKLPAGTVMVCDAEREVSIAGVMGGENSEINDATVDVVLESAYWNPSSIRRTSRALSIISDASQRFERGADPQGVRYALDRAASLVVELAGGSVLKGVIDRYPKKYHARPVMLRPSRVNKILGTELTLSQVEGALRLLDIRRTGKRKKDAIEYSVPTYRVDIDREIDLIEEVARVYGYDRIEARTSAAIDFSHPFSPQTTSENVRQALIGAGFQEAISNSMLDERRATLPGKTPVHILNPQNQEMAVLRTSMIPALLEAVGKNINYGSRSLRLFEIGHVFSIDNTDKPKIVQDILEEEMVGIVMTGSAEPRHWSQPDRTVDIFDAKGVVETLLAKFALDKFNLISYPTSNGLTEDTLAIEIQGSYAGLVGRATKEVLQRAGVDQDVYVAEFSLAVLKGGGSHKYASIPKFPRVRRDVAFIMGNGVAAAEVESVIRRSAGELLQTVEVFDVYEGDGLPEGKKSLAFSLELMSEVKTLTDAEIEAAVRKVVTQVEQAFGATLRSVK